MDEIWSRKMMRRLALMAAISTVAMPVAANEATNKAKVQPSQQRAVTLADLLRQDAAESTNHSTAPLPPKSTTPKSTTQSDTAEQKQVSLGDLLTQGWGNKRYTVTVGPRRQSKPIQSLNTVVVDQPAESASREIDLVPTAPTEQLAESKPVKETVVKQETAELEAVEPGSVAQNSVEPTIAGPIEQLTVEQPVADQQVTAQPVVEQLPSPAPAKVEPEKLAQELPKELPVELDTEPPAEPSAEPPAESFAHQLPPKLPADMSAEKVSTNEPAQGADTPLKELSDDVKTSKLADLLQEAPDFSATESKLKPKVVAKPASSKPLKAQADLIEQELESPYLAERQSELVRENAVKNGFGLLDGGPLQLPQEAFSPPPLPKPQPSSTAVIHAAQLQQVAQGLLRDAFHSLTRNTSYTAKKKALAGLRSVVAMRDALDGGNGHARDLELAMDAIRESREFGLGINAVDHEQLKRLVAIHKTQVLKDQPLKDVSSLQAVIAYLDFAQEKIVSAAGNQQEAAYALQLLGKIERRMHGAMDTHAAAVTMTYQRASVQVDPSSATARYELGRTYASQGLPQLACQVLAESIQLQPTRAAYEQLMHTARGMGDIDTVGKCKRALQDPSLPSSLPIYQLDPSIFASTHQPQFNPKQATNSATSKPGQQKTGARGARVVSSQSKHAAEVNTARHTHKAKKSSDVTAIGRLRHLFSGKK